MPGFVAVVGVVACVTAVVGCVVLAVVVAPVFTGALFSGAPTDISQRWPGWPCAGFKLPVVAGVLTVVVAAVVVAGTVVEIGAVVNGAPSGTSHR